MIKQGKKKNFGALCVPHGLPDLNSDASIRWDAYTLDMYCPAAKLSVELDGFQHGMPEQQQHDEERKRFLASAGIEELRFWNHQWRANRDGVLLEIWNALNVRTGWVAVMRRVENHRYVPPKAGQINQKPIKPV